jgi:hypothetical protein
MQEFLTCLRGLLRVPRSMSCEHGNLSYMPQREKRSETLQPKGIGIESATINGSRHGALNPSAENVDLRHGWKMSEL